MQTVGQVTRQQFSLTKGFPFSFPQKAPQNLNFVWQLLIAYTNPLLPFYLTNKIPQLLRATMHRLKYCNSQPLLKLRVAKFGL